MGRHFADVASDLMKHFKLKHIGNDTFSNAEAPWSHHHNDIIPGAFTLPQVALAAYMTIPDDTDLVLHCLQSHFVAPGIKTKSLVYKVDRVKTTSSSALRSIRIEQDGKAIMLSTASFAKKRNTSSTIKHSVERRSGPPSGEWKIELDDFYPVRNQAVTTISAERLPVARLNEEPSPATDVVPILLQLLPSIFPPELTQAATAHIIGLVGLSDLYLLDSPLTLYGLSYGIPGIGDRHRNLTKSDTKFLVTTNHTVYFHMCDGFRADELFYVEATSPWAKDGRVFIESRIFQGSEGQNLVATCVQEGLIFLKDAPSSKI